MVLDLTSLWAGPLCGALLADAGARVVKVESVDRPDGARLGNAELFDLLNAGKESVALDLRTPRGREQLAGLVAHADVVLEAARPRALEQLGLWRDELMAAAGRRCGCRSPRTAAPFAARDRVGFGDDAGWPGGWWSWTRWSVLLADAVADPITGLTAAVAVAEALAGGGAGPWTWRGRPWWPGWPAGPSGGTDARGDVVAGPTTGPRGPPLGGDTDAVLDELVPDR